MSEPATYALFRAARVSAIHLEQRDAYTPNDPVWTDWREGHPVEPVQRYQTWYDLICRTTGRGVGVHRLRIVSEPVTDYIRFEHETTNALNLAAGEQVRWLPRAAAWDLLVPAVDFWVFDNEIVVLNHFDGNGDWVREERKEDPAAAERIASAFEALWDRAIDHKDYRPA